MKRRAFITGLAAAFAAPAIVRAEVLMPVRKLILPPHPSLMPEALAWIPCDGRVLSRALYADLFKVIGIQFGRGDGLTTFGVPNLELGDRIPTEFRVLARPIWLDSPRHGEGAQVQIPVGTLGTIPRPQ